MNFQSIRFRLIGWYSGLIIGVFLAFGTYTYYGLQHYLFSSLQQGLNLRTRQIGEGLLSEIDNRGEPYAIEAIKNGYAPEANDRFIRLTRPDGSLLYVSGSSKNTSFNPKKIPLLDRENRPRDGELYLSGNLLFVSRIFSERAGENYLIEVGAPYNPIQATLHGLLITLACGLPVVAAIAVGGGYALVGRALLPVEQLVQSAEKISLQHLDKRLPSVHTGDELEMLSLALNRMISRLEDSFELTNRFASDASHELRTPLTIMRGELEVAMQEPNLSPQMLESMASILEETERLGKIVEGLLAVSRLEAGEAQLQQEHLDLAQLTRSTLEQMSLLAEEKSITLGATQLQPVEIEGDPARLKQVIVNLVDNAIKYTATGGSIEVSTAQEGHFAVLRVKDSGIGIPEALVPRVFDRFFRADKSRSRDVGGSGLGLSIVRSICLAHGGDVKIESKEGEGTTVVVWLPSEGPRTEGVIADLTRTLKYKTARIFKSDQPDQG
jgi:heavy metal sensor kinase